MFCNFSYPIQDLSFKISTSDKRRYRYHLRDIYSKKSCGVENPLTDLSNVSNDKKLKNVGKCENVEWKNKWKAWMDQAWSDTQELFLDVDQNCV